MVSLPQKVLIEPNAIEKIGDMCKELGLNGKPLVICDPALEFGETIARITGAETLSPESSEMAYLKNLSEKAGPFSFIIGVGGGRTIDMAKYLSYLSGKKWVCFPTILSHDGVVSSRAAITDNGAKISLDAKEPVAIAIDSEIIRNAPYRYIAAGAADVVSNVSSVEDWRLGSELGEKYSTVVAELSLLSAKAVISHVKEIRERTEHGIYTLGWSLICSGLAMNIYGSSRPASGSEHNFSHALEKLGSTLIHGEQCALGTIISTYLQNKDWRKIKSVFHELGIPTHVNDMDIGESMLIDALVLAKSIRVHPRYTILDRYHINRARAKEILGNVRII
ncbi:MAG: iron-containing alcohol dehydrogenase [Candidatus Aenigmarchaeota archaeon]|nr:iron-containing alcohol dehydrogenase [Candidatus Aenigmarchaeota archaeon]